MFTTACSPLPYILLAKHLKDISTVSSPSKGKHTAYGTFGWPGGGYHTIFVAVARHSIAGLSLH